MIPLNELTPEARISEGNRQRMREVGLRVACPGIILSFNPEEQTVAVQPAIREKRVLPSGDEKWVDIPQLVDVPIVFPRAGGYALTLPVKPGDECLVVFGDSCMDAWWQSGGVQNQIDCRRHDLSDGYAIIGPWSQPRVLKNYSTNTAQLRNESGSAYVEVSGDTVNIVGDTVNIKGGKVYINS